MANQRHSKSQSVAMFDFVAQFFYVQSMMWKEREGKGKGKERERTWTREGKEKKGEERREWLVLLISVTQTRGRSFLIGGGLSSI